MTPLILSALLLLANVSASSQANAGESAGLQRSEAPLRGLGTWYDAPSRTDAAAGPALRDMLGPDWRGSWVTVTSGSRSTNVRLTDWCRCPGGRVIDLDDAAFAELAPLSRGVVRVTVERMGSIRLPDTSTAP